MIEDIQLRYTEIQDDIITNQKDVFNMREYYSRKYAKYSNRLNDVNVGLFLNDRQQPTVQIFLRNKTGYIRTHLIFNRAGDTLVNTIILNSKLND